MNKIITVISICLILCSCECKKINNRNQIDFLKSKIESVKYKLENKVMETGYSPAGKKFIEISQQFTKKTNELVSKVSKNEEITKSHIRKLEKLAFYKNTTIKMDTAFIYRALEQYNHSKNSNVFITSLLMFNLSTINNIRELLQSYFFDVEYFKPVVLSDKFTIKKGETFRGTVLAQAKMVGIKYLYEIDDPQTKEGFIELSAWATSNYDGLIKLKGIKVGTHKVKVKSIHLLNGEEREFVDEFEITVTN